MKKLVTDLRLKNVQDPPSFAKRDWLRGIEKEIQAYWEQIHAFEEDAPDDPSIPKVLRQDLLDLLLFVLLLIQCLCVIFSIS
jgi:hypothetical protein